MTSDLSTHKGEAGSDSNGSAEGLSNKLNNALHKTKLLMKRSTDFLALNWHDVAVDYGHGKNALYLRLTRTVGVGDNNSFSFLIVKDMVVSGGPNYDTSVTTNKNPITDRQRARLHTRIGMNQVQPVLVCISDLVYCPQQVVSSRVWLLGHNESVLIGRELLVKLILGPFAWKRFRLPIAHPSKWETYTRHAVTVHGDKGHHHLVQRGSEMPDCLDKFPGNAFGDRLDAACDHMKHTAVEFGPEGIRVTCNEAGDQAFEVIEFGLSTFDLFE